jgi:hypothetical protein
MSDGIRAGIKGVRTKAQTCKVVLFIEIHKRATGAEKIFLQKVI